MATASAPCPRKIKGSIGSRIRVILGESGKEWLLLLNHDDGDRQWQSTDWKSIPYKVSKQLNNLTNKDRYCKEIDFGPTGDWYIHGIKRDGTGAHSWWGVDNGYGSNKLEELTGGPDYIKASFGTNFIGGNVYCIISGRNGYCCNADKDLIKRLERIRNRGKAVKLVRLFADGGYFIKDDEGSEWQCVGEYCGKELKNGGNVEDVAVSNDRSWVVIFSTHFSSSVDVDSALTKQLADFYRDQRARQTRRDLQINQYHERILREEQERLAAEREAEAQRLRAEAERAQWLREEAERAAEEEARKEAERIAKAIAEEEARKEAERLAKEKAAEEAIRKASELEAKLEKVLFDEKVGIEQMQACLRDRKRSFENAIKELPVEKRARYKINEEETKNEALCIVCHDNVAVQAIVPCGHHCLCDSCAFRIITESPEAYQFCPLCRGVIQSTLKIFGSSSM